MGFWGYTICVYLAVSGLSLDRQVLDNSFRGKPMGVVSRDAFLIVTGPSTIAVFGLPIYGFFIMPWWKPILGLLIAMGLAHVITRRLAARSAHLSPWAIGFSLANVALFIALVMR